MGLRPSYWRSARIGLAVLVVLGLGPGIARAQSDGLAGVCQPGTECALAVGSIRILHPRIGTGLWGGSAVPGSASTLGKRIGATPRVSLSTRAVLLPLELPPLRERSLDTGSHWLAVGVSGQATVGLLGGWSPASTVGGVGSLDALVRVSYLALPNGAFQDGVLGAFAGLRVGLLRESFTLPGVSVTGGYGRSTSIAFGDSAVDEGYFDGSIETWKATLAGSKTFGPMGLTLGTAFDRYTGDVELSYRAANSPIQTDATTDRWSVYAAAAVTRLVFHFSVEAGWQSAPVPDGLPSAVALDPPGWWVAAAFRVTI